MKDPNKILTELVNDSQQENQSTSEWLDFLHELRSEVQTMIDAAESDLENEDNEE